MKVIYNKSRENVGGGGSRKIPSSFPKCSPVGSDNRDLI